MSGKLESRLYEVPPSQFVQARDALAAELTARGERERAAEVKALRKPNTVLWAANQLARRAPAAVRALLAAAAEMRGALGDELRDATRDEREQLAQLVREGESALAEGGHPTSATTTRQLYALLHAAAAGDEETRAALAEGRLATAPEAPTLFTVAADAKPTRSEHAPRERAQRDRGERERERDQERERERERQRERLQQEAKTLRAEADRLTDLATDARNRARDAQRKADDAERAADKARRAAEAAEHAAR